MMVLLECSVRTLIKYTVIVGNVAAGELLDMCQKRVEKPNEFVEMFDERMPPPTPPEVPSSVTVFITL